MRCLDDTDPSRRPSAEEIIERIEAVEKQAAKYAVCGALTTSNASTSNPGPSSAIAGPSSAITDPSSSKPGPSSSISGPSSSKPGPSSAIAGPSSAITGPSSSNPVESTASDVPVVKFRKVKVTSKKGPKFKKIIKDISDSD